MCDKKKEERSTRCCQNELNDDAETTYCEFQIMGQQSEKLRRRWWAFCCGQQMPATTTWWKNFNKLPSNGDLAVSEVIFTANHMNDGNNNKRHKKIHIIQWNATEPDN